MKVTRVLEGELYTSPADKGLGYIRAVAEEDGYEIDYAGAVIWLTDAMIGEAQRQSMRRLPSEVADAQAYATDGDGLEETEATGEAESIVEVIADVIGRERCPHCQRPDAPLGCGFDCTTCKGCGKQLADGAPRVLTTADWVYCMECGK
jgi:hypothetical protein